MDGHVRIHHVNNYENKKLSKQYYQAVGYNHVYIIALPTYSDKGKLVLVAHLLFVHVHADY